jgi:O-antigen ligase
VKKVKIKAFSRPELAAAICGLADSSVWLVVLLTLPIEPYYALTIGLKCASLAVRGSVSFSHKNFLIFIVPVLSAAVLSVVAGLSEPSSLLSVVPFALSLSLTLALVCEKTYRAYFSAFAFSVFLSIMLYLGQWATGRVLSENGRWLYLGGRSPNLGGEIIFSGVLAAAISINLRSLYFFAYAVLASASVLLLQSRASLLAIVTIGLSASYFTLLKKFDPTMRIIVASSVLVALVGLFLLFGSSSNSLNQILLLNDEYRGLGTGFVGREERWDFAIETFLQYPLSGVGFGYFREEAISDLSPHSFWLHMLAEMGLLSIISFYALAKAAYELFKFNRKIFVFCCSTLVLTIFNDRFINMNPYPFLLYVILFLGEGAWSKFLSRSSVYAVSGEQLQSPLVPYRRLSKRA